MEKESFENEEIAKLMNEFYVNIKVDREERPDIDKIYQMSQSIITGKSGGWPLTIFMDNNKFPFFGGTYFPKDEKHGLPAFKSILQKVHEVYTEQRTKIIEQKNLITKSLELKNVLDLNFFSV